MNMQPCKDATFARVYPALPQLRAFHNPPATWLEAVRGTISIFRISLSIPTDIYHSCIGYHTVVSEMLLFTRGILTKFVCLAPSHDNGLKGS